ncbi:MAG: hypothetical protein M3P46_03265 [Actinomycetota bacterium]|nr:hypothetical protein [Actinomycetota bacterium]
MIDFSRPQLRSYDVANAVAVPLSYWLSPSVATTSGIAPFARLAVADWRQRVDVPWPPLKAGSAGSQAMSPAATRTGSSERTVTAAAGVVAPGTADGTAPQSTAVRGSASRSNRRRVGRSTYISLAGDRHRQVDGG